MNTVHTSNAQLRNIQRKGLPRKDSPTTECDRSGTESKHRIQKGNSVYIRGFKDFGKPHFKIQKFTVTYA